MHDQTLPKKIAIFSPQLTPVGTGRVLLSLAKGFAKHGHYVDLLRTGTEWEKLESDSSNPRVVDLLTRNLVSHLPRYGKSFKTSIAVIRAMALPKLVMYFAREKPQVLLVGLSTALPFLAKTISRSSVGIVVTIQGLPRRSWLRRRLWSTLYPQADAVIAPTQGVARETSHLSGLAEQEIKIIPNPVLDYSFENKMSAPIEHPWFDKLTPVILGVGRLTRQKGFDNLLQAFNIVRLKTPSKLIILGNGENRQSLENLIRSLKLDKIVDMPGHVSNPYAYMSRASVFVLSSRWEGPGHALIEALATGTPAVSTDCPFGPKDVLLNGQAGLLTPVDDPQALAKAILQTILNPQAAAQRSEIGRLQSRLWYADPVINRYLDIINNAQNQSLGQ